jgi:hypothetical protein
MIEVNAKMEGHGCYCRLNNDQWLVTNDEIRRLATCFIGYLVIVISNRGFRHFREERSVIAPLAKDFELAHQTKHLVTLVYFLAR